MGRLGRRGRTGACSGREVQRGVPTAQLAERVHRQHLSGARGVVAAKVSTNAQAFDFLVGEWEIEMLVMPQGASAGRRAVSLVHRILDGAALLDEIRHLDDSGEVNFRGASFRTYVPESDRWYVVWVMANVEGYSELSAQVVDGEVRTTGQGRDPGGKLVERGSYHDISPDGYSFTLDRSYNDGETWIRPFVSYKAARRKSTGDAA